jgi:hypothetical protein
MDEDEITPEDVGPVVASWLVKVVMRAESASKAVVTPTNAQLEEAIRSMVATSWRGLQVTTDAERTDR